ncbi:MAG: hypothetical protein CM1200mP17_08450 [Woeseia sp.]|nr:MAG: hypothetical protein CM1200mP17_08450 [Woeseia sp.]
MGSAFMDAMDIFEPAGIRFISVVHEQGAAHMAEVTLVLVANRVYV